MDIADKATKNVDHGKCVSPDTLLPLADGRILTAEQIFNLYAKNIKRIKDGYLAEVKDGLVLFTFDGKKIVKKRPTYIWKLNSPEKLVKVKLSSGDEIITTLDHPFFILTSNAEIIQKNASDLTCDDFVLLPRKLDFDQSFSEAKKYFVDKLKNLKDMIVMLNKRKSKKFFKRLFSENLQELRRKNLFTTDPYTSVKQNRFRARDFVSLSNYFGFSSDEIYDMIGKIKNASEKWRVGHGSHWMKIPQSKQEFEKMGYVLGCIAGDGYVKEGKLNKNEKNVQAAYREAIKKAFGLKTKVINGHTCDVVLTNGGKTFARFLTDIIGFPKINKSSLIEVPEIAQKNQTILKGFIEGLFDTDGYVSPINNCIEITSKSEKIVREVGILLLGMGIHSKIYEKNGYFNLRIAHRPYLKLFLLYFDPKFKKRKQRISKAIEKSSTSRIFDLTPIQGLILDGLNIKNVNKKIPYFKNYKKCKRLSRNFLKKLLKILPNGVKIKKKLKVIVDLPVSYVKVLSKEIINSPYEFVYDFTVPKTHNFIANRIIIHNTTLLDRIRGTSVTALEPGELTQHVGASYIPSSVINKICGELLKKLKVELKVPGLLFIDTPGHAAFMSMRKRGGSIADLAILVIDVNEGFQEQTDESLNVLKQFKVPFVVAATKIDKIQGWYPQKGKCFLDSFEFQRDEVKEELDKKIYLLVSQLAERGFDAERIDRVRDFKKQIAIVPTSGTTGEGIPELLVVLAGLAQQFLKEKLKLSEICRGSVLEVKETIGFGITIDAIIYDGEIGRGYFLIIGGKEPIVTRVKALLKPRPLGELRVEKKFESVEKVQASAGVKIAAPGLEMVIAGSPLIAVKNEEEVEKAKELVKKEVEEIEFTKEVEGVVLKADTLGSLEAMIKLLQDEKIPIRKAEVGHVTKQDIIEVQNVKDDLRRVILAFNVKILDEASELAQNLKIKIFQNNIIYRLMEDYKKWCFEEKERKIKEKLEKVSRPVKIKLLKGFTFRTSKPCIVGVEVLAGILKPGVLLRRKDGKIVGSVKEIQSEGRRIEEAKPGDRVAISMEEPTMGRQINEGDVLISVISEEDIKVLRELWDRISESEREILEEMMK